MELKYQVAHRLLQRRTALGLSQSQLAARFGVRQAEVSKFENAGLSRIERIVQVAAALECEPAWLAFGIGSDPSDPQ